MVGTFSVDSLREVVEDEPDTSFLTHEINFYQVSANCTSYTVVCTLFMYILYMCMCECTMQHSVQSIEFCRNY